MHLTVSTDPERFKALVANEFSPVWIENSTPKTGWPEGDGPEHHHHSAKAPEPEPLDHSVLPPPVLRDAVFLDRLLDCGLLVRHRRCRRIGPDDAGFSPRCRQRRRSAARRRFTRSPPSMAGMT
jgi:hypothetical protein